MVNYLKILKRDKSGFTDEELMWQVNQREKIIFFFLIRLFVIVMFIMTVAISLLIEELYGIAIIYCFIEGIMVSFLLRGTIKAEEALQER